MVEAGSLASLNLLAANPPRYPVNPTDEPREPLTLYISRVPGTRDVILSTLKPQRKNVTFEDVANALYYIHLDVPSDLALQTSLQPSNASPASIARKPVPSHLTPLSVPPVAVPPLAASEALAVQPPVSPIHAEVARRPVPGPQPVLAPPSPGLQPAPVQSTSQPTIARKPLGPRPLNPLSDYERSQLPPLPPRPTPSLSSSSLPPSPTHRSPPSPTHKSSPFQLTVIRRDPSTNHQWNIGKVIGDEVLSQTQPPAHPYEDSPKIKIVLETSGYAKFRDTTDDAFHRDVAMAYGKSWTAGLRKVKDVFREVARPRGSSVSASHEAAPAVDRSRNNRHSFDGRLEKERAERVEKAEKEKERESDLKPKGYAFASPWDGRCEFRTGNGGRSLKCRHIMGDAANSAGGYNPLAIVQGIKDGQGIGAVAGIAGQGRARAGSLSSALIGAVPVSELRFNLPSGDIFGKGSHAKGSKSSSSHSEDSYEDEDDDDEFAGLGLGKEKAGGGNRGKRAKLGKLIVYDDGFKMLDLVVAANVGVWWVSWEKVF
ncbi:oxidoreductase-like protein [Ophiostoma piceae UAMH 11346]|uniref:Oxidoreductase-like protein n=1 Tax=Ophiostoma piceae (strain UAMH 11346) TaxID=1262450 RepID=S3BY36_OPHP1|nr:oxidoreductase-like protein [Ophiostoma piceae UAMH 11346]